MKFDVLLLLLCGLLLACTESLPLHLNPISLSCLSRSHKTSLSYQSEGPIPTDLNSVTSNTQQHDKALPKWLLAKNRSPPYWLLSDDLPAWFSEGPPKWLSERGFRPPSWMLQNVIPPILDSYGSIGPPAWLLNMDKLPDWFNEVDVLPYWLLAFQEVSPPKWALSNDIPDWLKKGDIPDWIVDEGEVANLNRWLHNVDEKYPKWMLEGTYPSWVENIPNKMKNADSYLANDIKDSKSQPELGYLKQALVRYKVIYGDMFVPPNFVVPKSSRWPDRLWDMKLGKAVELIKEQFMYVDRWDDLLRIGFPFNGDEGKRAVECFKLNKNTDTNTLQKRLQMKANDQALKRKAEEISARCRNLSQILQTQMKESQQDAGIFPITNDEALKMKAEEISARCRQIMKESRPDTFKEAKGSSSDGLNDRSLPFYLRIVNKLVDENVLQEAEEEKKLQEAESWADALNKATRAYNALKEEDPEDFIESNVGSETVTDDIDDYDKDFSWDDYGNDSDAYFG
jgi:hypothetical protein